MSAQAQTITTKAVTDRESGWISLCKLCGAAALILLVYSLVTMVLLVLIGGQPETAQEGFDMLQENRLVGLLRLDVLTVLVMPLYYVLFFGLYLALKKTNVTYIALAAVLGIAGVTMFLSTPSVFSWLALSDKFAVAATEAQRAQLLAAGEAILASDMWHGTGAVMSGLLVQTATLSMSVMMLRNSAFRKLTAWIGIVMHGLDLLHILVGFVTPAAGVVLMWVAGPLYLVWFPLLAMDFYRIARNNL